MRAAVLLALFFSPSRASEERESFQQAACAADGPSPLFALLLVGNFRTFYDPRVYKSIRTNLIDALGARSVVFIYGKLDSENVRGLCLVMVSMKHPMPRATGGVSSLLASTVQTHPRPRPS